MDWLTDPEFWASLLTLTALEIVLGIDNLVFIAIARRATLIADGAGFHVPKGISTPRLGSRSALRR
jgi:hypothetical protein